MHLNVFSVEREHWSERCFESTLNLLEIYQFAIVVLLLLYFIWFFFFLVGFVCWIFLRFQYSIHKMWLEKYLYLFAAPFILCRHSLYFSFDIEFVEGVNLLTIFRCFKFRFLFLFPMICYWVFCSCDFETMFLIVDFF